MKTSLKDGIYVLHRSLSHKGGTFPYWVLQIVDKHVHYCNGWFAQTATFKLATQHKIDSQYRVNASKIVKSLQDCNYIDDILYEFERYSVYRPFSNNDVPASPVADSKCACKWHNKLIDYKVTVLRIKERNISPDNPYDAKMLLEEASSVVRRTFPAWPTCANEPLELNMRHDYVHHALVFEWKCKYHESQ